jgi:hypothetical protein
MSREEGTVPSLMAEEPERGCRVHCDGEGGHFTCTGSHGLETRVDATEHGLARSGKRWLRHGVVLGVEDERDGVTDCGCDVGGREGKLAVGTDLNREVCCRDDGDEGGEGNGSKEAS